MSGKVHQSALKLQIDPCHSELSVHFLLCQKFSCAWVDLPKCCEAYDVVNTSIEGGDDHLDVEVKKEGNRPTLRHFLQNTLM